ncbi:hypothetical protein CASFOL_016037 [Castilleja foliolosa]|uniref:Uncharacterized protein n=1 Tax=Castilleja foliolosa TaxID=1961234 RepID=A0ABD3DGU7_9LAMI
MANPQTRFRSISFPSRSQPTNFETQLKKPKSCEVDPISSQAIQSGLLDLANYVQNLTQSTNYVHQDIKSIEQSLSGSIELLDSWGAIKELFQMMKENVHALQSAIRRKGLEYNSNIQNDINSYICIRKRMSKCISKTLKTLKNLENENLDVTGPTIALFKSVLGFLSCPAGRSGGWNLVSRLMMVKSVDRAMSEVRCVDSVLGAIRNGDSNKGVDLQMVLRSLQNLDDCVEGIELGLQRLFRQLMHFRVMLLNIVTDH